MTSAAPLHSLVLPRGVPGAAYPAEQPVREAPGERSGLWPRTGGGGEPELMDLRVYAPRPDVVSGPVDRLTARLLAELAGKQLHRAPHVILELAMTVVRRCVEGWSQLNHGARPSMAARHAYDTHGALHEAVRAISLFIETFRVEAATLATPAGRPNAHRE